MDERIPSYPKVYNLGHPAIRDLFDGMVTAQEKVDGSQFSFGSLKGEVVMRSKGAVVYSNATDKNFTAAVRTVLDLFDRGMLVDGWVYRGEVLSKPKHNSLAYDRVPAGNIILFDVDTNGQQNYLSADTLGGEAQRLGLEVVPTIPLPASGVWSPGAIETTLQQQSCLGGQLIEGIVFKNYERFGKDGKTLMGKHVSEAFKEVHAAAWKAANPGRQDVVESLIHGLRTPARWDKAVQHLRDRGELTGTPKDIGGLIKEVQTDTLAEMAEEVQAVLFKHFWPQIQRGITGGLPEWYKESLMETQFAGEPVGYDPVIQND